MADDSNRTRPMTEIADLSARELLDAFGVRRLSPVEAVAACAARIEALDPRLNVFVTLCLDRGLTGRAAAEEFAVTVLPTRRAHARR